MAVAISLERYLASREIAYEIVTHPRALTTAACARAAGVPMDQVAKTVVLQDEDGYFLAVVPATHHLELGTLHRWMHRRVGLATEEEIADLFRDCELGAVPPVGAPYGLEVVIDDELAQQPDLYFEAGDHQSLIHVTRTDFERLLAGARHGHFSHPDE